MSSPPARVTLPPTWTPTFTPTPLPPSLTPTLTLTPSPVPTASAEEICANFEVLYDFDTGKPFPWEGSIPLMMSTHTADTVIRFVAVHRQTQENQGIQLPGGQMIVAEFPINLLPHPGLYDYTFSVYSETYGNLCQREGTFVVLRPAVIENESTPEATSEAETVE